MANLLHHVTSNYNELLESSTDPTVDKWFMMGSPGPVVCILAAYLIFVLKLGPKMMENRPAFQLKTVIILYNGIQVLFSVWLCFKVLELDLVNALVATEYNNKKGENNADPRQLAIANYGWWYLLAKMTELLDTVFFVLRKKQNQVTFLHVYHHTIMASFTWGYLKLIPGGQGIIIGCLNSFVHVVMYSYYLIAALGPAYQKYLWWKKYMTWMQLLQFGIMLTYLTYLLAVDSNLPKGVTYFFGTNITIFLYLFTDFYLKTYKQKRV